MELKAADLENEEDDFSCDDPGDVALMIDYMYLGDYQPKPVRISEEPKEDRSMRPPETAHANAIAAGSTEATEEGGTTAIEGPPIENNTNDTGAVSEARIPKEKKSKLTKSKKKKRLGIGRLSTHARLYAMGSKYNIPSLKSQATSKFLSEASKEWNSRDFARAITVAFESTLDTDRGFRDAIVSVVLEQSTAMASDEHIATAIKSTEGLAFELFEQQSKRAPRTAGWTAAQMPGPSQGVKGAFQFGA